MNKEIILASASQRRHELLKRMGYKFTIEVSAADENIEKTTPSEYVCELSRIKALAVFQNGHDNDCVIGADTIVVLDNEIIGKPKDDADAKRILSKLSGRVHTVYTGVTVMTKECILTDYDSTDVTFSKLTEADIDEYIATGEPCDRAGAYGIQGIFCVHVPKICGSYFNVVGFPVHLVYDMLRNVGLTR